MIPVTVDEFESLAGAMIAAVAEMPSPRPRVLINHDNQRIQLSIDRHHIYLDCTRIHRAPDEPFDGPVLAAKLLRAFVKQFNEQQRPRRRRLPRRR